MKTTFALLLLVAAVCSVATEYTFAPLDVIMVQIVEHPEFSGRHRIRPDGKINFPVLGEIKLQGKTVPSAIAVLEKRLSSYIHNPVASIGIEEFSSWKITVIGNVKSPGQFKITGRTHIVDALTMAGGLDNKKVGKAKVLCRDGSDWTFNLKKAVKKGDLLKSEAYYVNIGDIVFVESDPLFDWPELNMMATTILAFLGLLSVLKTAGGWLSGLRILKNAKGLRLTSRNGTE